MGERKQPHKYLSKVYIYPGICSALLYFGGKTITRLNQRCHYKHLRKVHISNGDFNLGRNEAVHNAAAQICFSLYLRHAVKEDVRETRPDLLVGLIHDVASLTQPVNICSSGYYQGNTANEA